MNRLIITIAVVLSSIMVLNAYTDKPSGKYAAQPETVHNMDNATKIVFADSDFIVTAKGLVLRPSLSNSIVEVDSAIDVEELLFVREEIVVRVSENDKFSIIAGDNGQF